MNDPAIKIQCLGEFAVQGLAADLRGSKQVALLGFLAANLGTHCPRETLMSVFWGDRFNDQARQSLRQALSALRRAFLHSPNSLEIDRGGVRLDPRSVSVDIKQAETALAEGDLERAAKIFRHGDFLGALNPKESGISEWLSVEREKWRELGRRTLLEYGEGLIQEGQSSSAEETATWLLRRDPIDEAAARLAMRSMAANGSLSGAVKLYRRLCTDLDAELGVQPAAETIACFERLQQGAGARGNVEIVPGLGEVPTISVERFDFAPEDAATKTMSADIRDQLIVRLTKRMGVTILDEQTGVTDKSTYILKGRLRTSGHQGRLSISMILREQARPVFSQNYTGDTSDSFKFCDDLVAQVETNLRVQTNAFDGERLSHLPDDQLSVAELRARAANLLHTGTVKGFFHAERLMDRAVGLDPADPFSIALSANIKIWLMLAGCLEMSNADQDQLGSDLNAALEAQNRSDYIYHVRGTYFAVCRRNADATLKDGERALKINPNYALAYNTLGLGRLLLGDYTQAVSCLRKYVELSDNDPLLPARLFPLAVAHYCNGDFQEADAALEQAIGLKPNHRLFHRLQAMCLRAMGKDDEADRAERSANKLPDTPSILAVCPPLHQNQSDLFAKLAQQPIQVSLGRSVGI